MACTSRYEEWSRDWIAALHRGRELVDGKPRRTYQQIADELGTTKLRVEKAAQRYGASQAGRYGYAWFTDSERKTIQDIIAEGVNVRLMCAKELQRLLLSRGFKVSRTTIRKYVRTDIEVLRQYEKNVIRKRRRSAHLATMRRLAKMSARKAIQEVQDDVKSHGRITADGR